MVGVENFEISASRSQSARSASELYPDDRYPVRGELAYAVALCRYPHYASYPLLTASSREPHLALWIISIQIFISMYIIKSRRCPGRAPTTHFSWAFIGADIWPYGLFVSLSYERNRRQYISVFASLSDVNLTLKMMAGVAGLEPA